MAARIDSLNIIDVAAPCTADWDAMTGDERVRHCGQCQMNVYNLSEMSEREALQLVNEREGRTCIQFYRRADGTMLTKDCPVGLRAIRKAVRQKFARMWASTAALAGAIFFAGMGRTSHGQQIEAPEPEVKLPQVKLELPHIDDVRVIEVVKGKMCVIQPALPQLQLTYDGLKMMDAGTVKQYLNTCLAKEEQASYGMPDPDNKDALAENVRQAWQVKVDDASFVPLPGSKEHDELAKVTSDLLKKHQDVAAAIAAPQLQLIHAIRGQMILRPDVLPIPR